MDNDKSAIERRISRIEALISILFVSDADIYFSDGNKFRYVIEPILGSEYSGRELINQIYGFIDEEKITLRSKEIADRIKIFEKRLKDVELKSGVVPINVISNLTERLIEMDSNLKGSIVSANSRITTLFNLHDSLQIELHTYLIGQSFGIDIDEYPMHRYIPIKIYLSESDPEAVEKISKAIEKLTETISFSITDDFPAEYGSWWKRWIAKSQEVVTRKEVIERFEKIERAIELKGIHEPQSIVDKNEAEGTAAMLNSLNDIDHAALLIGSVLLIKYKNDNNEYIVQARTLTPKEMIYLEKNQQILSSPKNILSSLADFNQSFSLHPNE